MFLLYIIYLFIIIAKMSKGSHLPFEEKIKSRTEGFNIYWIQCKKLRWKLQSVESKIMLYIRF